MSGPYSRPWAQQAFSRAAGAPLLEGNLVRLLKDGRENYPAWLDAIREAKHYIHFESYIIHEDEVGRQFADALISAASRGVRVRIIYDWIGGFGKASSRFWRHLRSGGVEVRCFNPPRLDSPLGWLSRDHRKVLVMDDQVGFVSGLCVGQAWVGDPGRKIEPWRDTGVEVRGSAVPEISAAFAQVWAMLGDPIPEPDAPQPQASDGSPGQSLVRVVSTMPLNAGMSHVDELVAALARKRLWLTDAYYAGMTFYVRALTSAARDGVDVRLLVPSGTDIPLLRPLSQAGYLPLLEAGVRVFEWNGTMLHAKTAVADARWARVGSSNLNVWSWFGNCELDLIVEDESFCAAMEEMYLEDLTHATELVLGKRNRVLRNPQRPANARGKMWGSGGRASRAAAGAARLGSTVGAALTNRRVFEPVEGRILVATATLLLGLAALLYFYPQVLRYPALVLLVWLAVSLLLKAARL